MVGTWFSAGVLGVAILAVAIAGFSYASDANRAGVDAGKSPKAAFAIPAAQNLQILSNDMAYPDLVLLMTRYSQELGVQCVFCHTENPQTQQVDFASDESPAKLVARIMIGMVRDINGKYLAQVSDRRYAVPISCGNCHQGQTFPPVFEARAVQ